jgi:hypothetical protein
MYGRGEAHVWESVGRNQWVAVAYVGRMGYVLSLRERA